MKVTHIKKVLDYCVLKIFFSTKHCKFWGDQKRERNGSKQIWQRPLQPGDAAPSHLAQHSEVMTVPKAHPRGAGCSSAFGVSDPCRGESSEGGPWGERVCSPRVARSHLCATPPPCPCSLSAVPTAIIRATYRAL